MEKQNYVVNPSIFILFNKILFGISIFIANTWFVMEEESQSFVRCSYSIRLERRIKWSWSTEDQKRHLVVFQTRLIPPHTSSSLGKGKTDFFLFLCIQREHSRVIEDQQNKNAVFWRLVDVQCQGVQAVGEVQQLSQRHLRVVDLLGAVHHPHHVLLSEGIALWWKVCTHWKTKTPNHTLCVYSLLVDQKKSLTLVQSTNLNGFLVYGYIISPVWRDDLGLPDYHPKHVPDSIEAFISFESNTTGIGSREIPTGARMVSISTKELRSFEWTILVGTPEFWEDTRRGVEEGKNVSSVPDFQLPCIYGEERYIHYNKSKNSLEYCLVIDSLNVSLLSLISYHLISSKPPSCLTQQPSLL